MWCDRGQKKKCFSKRAIGALRTYVTSRFTATDPWEVINCGCARPRPCTPAFFRNGLPWNSSSLQQLCHSDDSPPFAASAKVPPKKVAPSFSCAKVQPASVEAAICGNAELSRLDRALARSFQDTVAAIDALAAITDMPREHGGWLAPNRLTQTFASVSLTATGKNAIAIGKAIASADRYERHPDGGCQRNGWSGQPPSAPALAVLNAGQASLTATQATQGQQIATLLTGQTSLAAVQIAQISKTPCVISGSTWKTRLPSQRTPKFEQVAPPCFRGANFDGLGQSGCSWKI